MSLGSIDGVVHLWKLVDSRPTVDWDVDQVLKLSIDWDVEGPNHYSSVDAFSIHDPMVRHEHVPHNPHNAVFRNS